MDDHPVDVHVLDCAVWVSELPCDCGADRASRPVVLLPDVGSLAVRLEQLARTLPCDGDVAS